MELNKKRVVEVSWLIDKTYKELEILDYSIESLKKFKYSFSLFEQHSNWEKTSYNPFFYVCNSSKGSRNH